ncbi:MAG: hypothetical protein QMD06_03585 [Candidatus Altarchaeum sp.]|nr:hypothetical protein [Candidatus Altarchaeum sp.]
MEHLNINLLKPKKSKIITVHKKDDYIWISGGEFTPFISSPQLSVYQIFRRSIDELMEENVYYNILDRLFPMVCNCKLHYTYDVNGNVMYIDSVKNVLKLIEAKNVEVKDESIFFQLSRKRIKYWFGGSFSGTNPLSNGEQLLKGLKIIKRYESIFDLFRIIEVHNKKMILQ